MQNSPKENPLIDTGSIVQEIYREEYIPVQQIQKREEDAVFIDENPQIVLDKLMKLKDCNYKERLAFTKRLGELLTWIGDSAIDNLNTIIQQILEDADEIKKNFIAQLEQICVLLKTKQNNQELIKQHVVKALQELLKSNNFDIKELAGNSISIVAKELNERDRGNLILTQVIQMAHDDNNDENVIIAVKLFGQLAADFGPELSESFIALEILSKGDDAKQPIRKEAVLQLANIAKVLSKDFIKHRLLPFFSKKTEERTWQTRKACLDIIVKLAEQTDTENFDLITGRLLALLDDQNKWVKQHAYKQLGKYISIITRSENINDKLLEFYLKMNDSDIRELGIDNEIVIECALYFPAVLQVYTEKKWPQLSKLFMKLIIHKDKVLLYNIPLRVKKPLACSLHVLAKLLGPSLAYSELLKVLEQLLQDPNDEIKHGAVENLGLFFDAIEESKRASLIDILLIIQKDQKKWRIRELIAKQISHLARVFDVETVFSIILPVSTKLCNDNVYAVRKAAAKQIFELYDKFSQNQNELYFNVLKQNILGFANSNMFNQRQSFVIMCEKLMKYEQFYVDFLEAFIHLGQDPIKNVRISVAKVLQKHLFKPKQQANEGLFKEQTSIKTLWNLLIKDNVVLNSLNIKKYPNTILQKTQQIQLTQSQVKFHLQEQPQIIQQEQKTLTDEDRQQTLSNSIPEQSQENQNKELMILEEQFEKSNQIDLIDCDSEQVKQDEENTQIIDNNEMDIKQNNYQDSLQNQIQLEPEVEKKEEEDEHDNQQESQQNDLKDVQDDSQNNQENNEKEIEQE
ncbi:unnamed protein product [Paramecium sonneborni]|uniref:Uncharacterized protein n=1 Tax=Paramecium sonneborni TaxID=65129 RepID=A0A8S1P741_9CILI|nr:unnamed protein product [Paramecium sonneborni]